MGRLLSARSVVLLSFVVGCGGATPAGTTTPNPPTEVASHWPDPVTTNTEAWNVSPFFWYGDPRYVGTDESGAHLVLAGESRARVTPSSVEWGLEATGLTFEDAQEMGGTWYFWDSSGTVLSAEGGFLGNLTEVGRAPVRVESTLISEGVLTARLLDQSIATFDPTRGVRVLPAPVNGPMVDAAFLSPTSGVVIAPPGRLYRTSDGDTFTPVDTGTAILVEVWPMDGAFWLRTSTGFLRVAPDGTSAPVDGDPPWPAEIPDDVQAQLEEALELREPFDFGPLPGPSGRVVLDWNDGTVDVWDPAEGLRMIQPPAGHCVERGLGDRVVAVCENEDGSLDIHLSEDMVHFRQLGSVRPRYGITDDVFLSPDGSSIVVQGRCGDPAEAGYETLCWHDGAGFRERTVPAESGVLSVLREHALLATYVAETGTGWVSVVDLSGTAEPTPLEAPPGVAILQHAHFAADGSISAIAFSNDGTVSLAIGRLGAPLEILPIPEGTSAFEMADAMHGIALGQSFGEIWGTTDGGHTWAPLPLPFRGVPQDYVTNAYEPLACSSMGCVVTGALFWGPDRVIPEASRNPAEALYFLPQSADPAPDPSDGTHSHSWTCTATATVAPRLDGLLLGPGWANFYEHFDQATSGYSVALRWGGADDRGAFSLTSQRLAVRSGSEGGTLIAATRRLGVVSRAGYDDELGAYVEDLLVATPDAAPRLVHVSSTADDLQRSASWGVAPALTLANGGLVILATGVTDMAPHITLHALIHLGPDGAEIARRLFVFPAEEHELFPAATSSNEVGLVSRARRGTALVFHPIGGGDSRAMGDLHTPGGACDRAAGRTRMLRTSTATSPVTINGESVGYEPLVNVIEVAANGDACVSAVFPSPYASYETVAETAFGVPLAWTSAGRVRAMSVSPEIGSVPLTCTVTPPPAE